MKTLFYLLLHEINLRWPRSKADIVKIDGKDIYFITIHGFENRFIQITELFAEIQILAKVIDTQKPENSLFEYMHIVPQSNKQHVFKRAQGVEFQVTDVSHVVDQIDIVLGQLDSVFGD
jgi:hypothetical protein